HRCESGAEGGAGRTGPARRVLRRAGHPARQPRAPVVRQLRDRVRGGVPARDTAGGGRTVSWEELARLGSPTVHEAAARSQVVDLDLVQVIPGSAAHGPARTVRCGQDDTRMVHAAVAEAKPGEVLVLTMPEPRPVALVGELLGTQMKGRGVAAVLVDAAVRDVEELRELELPVWARWVRIAGADKKAP